MHPLPDSLAALTACLVLLYASQTQAQDESALAGGWEANLPIGPASVQRTIQLELELRGSLESGFRGRFVNVTDGNAPFIIDRIEIDGSSILLRSCTLQINPFFEVIGGTYEGILTSDASEIRGLLYQNGAAFPIGFTRSASLSSEDQSSSPGESESGRGSDNACVHPARDAAERIVEALAEVVENGDRGAFRTFIAQRFAEAMLQAPGAADRWVDVLSAFQHASQGFELIEIQDAGSNWVTASVRNRLTGDRVTVSVTTTVEGQHLLRGWAFFPAAYEDPEPLTARQIARELERYVDRLAGGDVFSGAVLLAKDGEVVFERAYGMANKNHEVPNTLDTKFNIGSMNKMFTAVAIMQLVEAGELSLSDRLSKFMPSFPDETASQQITIEQLLTHGSGIGNHFTPEYMETSKARYRSVDDFLKLLEGQDLLFEPGTDNQYSNGGYIVAGKVIEVVSGQDYYDYVREHIYEPVGMVNSDHYELDLVVPNLAIGYSRQYTDAGAVFENNNYVHLRGSPGGGGYSTVGDLLRFANALFGNELLNAETVEIMVNEQAQISVFGACCSQYGYGFDLVDEYTRIGHSGGTAGAYAYFETYLDTGWTAVVLSNYSEGTVPAYPSVIAKIRRLIGGGPGGTG